MKVDWIFLGLIILFGILSLLILKPFINYIIFALVLVFLTYPLYKRLVGKVKNKSFAALLLIIGMFLIVIIPFFYISTTLFLETSDVLQQLSAVEFENLEQFEDDVHSWTGLELSITDDIT